MLTVGQINEKIILLRSKIAVTEGVILHLKTHYMPPEDAEPEMHFTRSDYGKVPTGHVESTIADYVNYLDTLRHELNVLESTPIQAVVVPAKIEATSEPAPAAAAPKTNGSHPAAQPAPKPAPRKETPSGTQRTSSDQPATQQQAVAGKAG